MKIVVLEVQKQIQEVMAVEMVMKMMVQWTLVTLMTGTGLIRILMK